MKWDCWRHPDLPTREKKNKSKVQNFMFSISLRNNADSYNRRPFLFFNVVGRKVLAVLPHPDGRGIVCGSVSNYSFLKCFF